MLKDTIPLVTILATLGYKRWFDALRDKEAKRRIEARLNRLRGDHIGDCSEVGDGVLEIRLHFGPGYRIYFVRQARVFVILLAGVTNQVRQAT
jgi:putative addiction module killer protein